MFSNRQWLGSGKTVRFVRVIGLCLVGLATVPTVALGVVSGGVQHHCGYWNSVCIEWWSVGHGVKKTLTKVLDFMR